MARIEFTNSLIDGQQQMIVSYMEQELFQNVVPELIQQMKEAIAAKFWEENKTQIMAKMDLQGLASLIAAFGAKEIAKGKP